MGCWSGPRLLFTILNGPKWWADELGGPEKCTFSELHVLLSPEINSLKFRASTGEPYWRDKLRPFVVFAWTRIALRLDPTCLQIIVSSNFIQFVQRNIWKLLKLASYKSNSPQKISVGWKITYLAIHPSRCELRTGMQIILLFLSRVTNSLSHHTEWRKYISRFIAYPLKSKAQPGLC